MAAQNQALLYSMISAAMIFERTSRQPDADEAAVHLAITNRAVGLLSQQMSDPTIATQEANIWAVVALGYSATVGPVRTGKLPQQSFLRELQSLHIYGRLRINQIHLAGLIQLVQMIGGPQNLKTPGMAGVMSLYETTRNQSSH